MKPQIYLDHSATTPVHPDVLEAMLPFFKERYGNPSSIHKMGRSVKIPIEDARTHIADALNTKPPRIVFTSGGTEADHLAIVGSAIANQDKGKHIIISEIEHSAIINATKLLEGFGFKITVLPVDKYGEIKIDQLKEAISEETILISIMYVNNEVGTIQPIEEIGTLARERGIIFHTDAVQAFPILDINVEKLPIDLLTISSHKINGPKGVGALYIRNGVNIHPVIGGTQERSRRGGTENVPGIVGFGEATRILSKTKAEKFKKLKEYKEKLMSELEGKIGKESFVVNGHPTNVVPSILNISFPGVKSNTMIMSLDMRGIAISGGSACASGVVDVSRIIKALNLAEDLTESAVRISFGYGNTLEEIEKAGKEIANIVNTQKNKRK